MPYTRKTNILLSGAVAAAMACGAGAQTTWYVDDDTCPSTGNGTEANPFCSIGVALLFAESGDEILVLPGTYDEAIDFAGKAVWLHSSEGAGVTTIDGLGSPHVVTAVTGEGPETILEGFTITGGNAAGNGGGMLIDSASPTVTDCVFTANQALFGAGVYVHESSPAFSGCTFSNNTATDRAGGMMLNGGAALVSNCLFTANTAGGALGGGGLWVATGAAPEILDSQFSLNQAARGAGMYVSDSSPTVIGCTFASNSANTGAQRWGGGVVNERGNPSFTACTFQANDAVYGAGMANLTSSPTLTTCVFQQNGNSATQRGGGMYNVGDVPGGTGQSNPVLIDCEFLANVAVWGGGMANDAREASGEYGPGSEPVLSGCLFFDNADVGSGRGAAMWNNRSSHAQLTACTFVSNVADWGGAVFSDYASHPVLDSCLFIGNFANYGGAIRSDHDSGGEMTGCQFSGNWASALGGAVYDLASASRLTDCTFEDNYADHGGGYFVGQHDAAAELTGCTFVNNRSDNGDVNGSGGGVYVQDAWAIVTGCVFDGNWALDHGGAIRVDRGSASGDSLEIDGSTFTSNWAWDHGGAIYAYQSGPAIETSVFEFNGAENYGGAIRFESGSTGSLADCTFTGNSATHGGALNMEQSTVAVSRCLFTQNLAALGHGGAVHSYANATELLDCEFIENSAWADGGALSDHSGSMSVVNCAFRGNDAEERGGAVRAYGASTSLMNVLVADNIARWGGAMYANGPASVVNTTFAGNVAWESGNGLYHGGGYPSITNSVLWDADFGVEIYSPGGVDVNYSDVRGGWPETNIDADPLFVDPAAGDYRLASGSPCIDAADNTAVPADDDDLDGDGITDEPCPVDLERGQRFVDDPYTEDSGVGDPPIVDMGAYEFQLAVCVWDLDGSGDVGTTDFLDLLAQWGTDPGGPPDFDGDGTVGTTDFLALLANWGPCS